MKSSGANIEIFSENQANTMAADALAPWDARSWYWLWMINGSFYLTMIGFHFVRHFSVDKW